LIETCSLNHKKERHDDRFKFKGRQTGFGKY